MATNSYSFLDTVANITGVGGSFSIGAGAKVGDEGITIERSDDDNVMTSGADGATVHSLIAGSQSTLTVRLLKTANANNLLMAMYQIQKNTRAGWGDNVITLSHLTRGDSWTMAQAAFKKMITVSYAKEADIYEWTFDCGKAIGVLGAGIDVTI